MNTALDECRWLYNHFLEERKTTYEQTGASPSLYDQQAALPDLKQDRPSLATVHSQVLQNVAVRVHEYRETGATVSSRSPVALALGVVTASGTRR